MSDNSTTTTMDPKNKKKCSVCDKISVKYTCVVCKIIHYCSQVHEISDGNSHSKKNCLFNPTDYPILGNYKATRDIEAGEIIFIEESPLLAVPERGGTCLNCYVRLKLENTKDCAHCGWPLCLGCTTHGDECKLTMKYLKQRVKVDEYTQLDPIYEAIICVLRAIAMREKDGKTYEKLMSLKDCCDEATDAIIAPPREMAVRINNFMEIGDMTVDEIAKIIGIMRTNAYQAASTSGNIYAAIYEKASYISHSCRPNCSNVIRSDSEDEGKIIVRAVRAIPKGDPITINYVDPLHGTKRRRDILRTTRFIDCACERCSDPTEFGTMFNAIKCFTDKCNGCMLPPTFLVSAEEKIPDYICNTCEAKRPSEEVDEMLDDISKILSNIAPDDVSELKKFIVDKSKSLHENHFLIFRAELNLAMPFDSHIRDLENASEKCWKENINVCKKLDDRLKKLMPGEIEWRGRVLYTEFANMSMLHDKLVKQNPSESDSWSKEQKYVLSEIHKCLRDESEYEWEGKLAKWARKFLKNLE